MNILSRMPNISLSDYDYILPKDKIAEYPLDVRSSSKLLYCSIDNNQLEHYKFSDITRLIPKDSLLVFNSTKVISARLKMQKPSGGKCELLLVDALEPSPDPAIVMSSDGLCSWRCMIGGRNVKEGLVLTMSEDNIYNLRAIVRMRESNYGEIDFIWNEGVPFSELISKIGDIPLPPYIERETELSDIERYQTVYARTEGSVAAPTAGLHFTDEVIRNIKSNGIGIIEVTLHVGPGTFLPISSTNIDEHNMHDELAVVEKCTILSIIENLKLNKNIIAVGTTSVRTLETLYWVGVKLILNKIPLGENIILNKDEPYQLANFARNISAIQSYSALIDFLDNQNNSQLLCRTMLFIMPGYDFKVINGIITNYHLPKSTLILLVAAFTGKDLWRSIYNSALENNYRFLSYGDSSFLFKENSNTIIN